MPGVAADLEERTGFCFVGTASQILERFQYEACPIVMGSRATILYPEQSRGIRNHRPDAACNYVRSLPGRLTIWHLGIPGAHRVLASGALTVKWARLSAKAVPIRRPSQALEKRAVRKSES
jgi:hypothetical protein